jgi:hypothetical protein
MTAFMCRSFVHLALASGFERKSLYVKSSLEASSQEPTLLYHRKFQHEPVLAGLDTDGLGSPD